MVYRQPDMGRSEYLKSLNKLIGGGDDPPEYEAGPYEIFARKHRGSFPVYLDRDPRPFWSKGWRGCPMNCGMRSEDLVNLVPFKERYPDGTIKAGFRCTHTWKPAC